MLWPGRVRGEIHKVGVHGINRILLGVKRVLKFLVRVLSYYPSVYPSEYEYLFPTIATRIHIPHHLPPGFHMLAAMYCLYYPVSSCYNNLLSIFVCTADKG